jgi:hypothetical protein
MAISDWDRGTLEARIVDDRSRQRHAGGSPDENELTAYAAALPPHTDNGTALVLGMTPELRRLALQRYRWLVSVDINPHAIALYRDWVDPADRPRERIIEADWMELPHLMEQPVQAVLGDGVFGNLPAPTAYRRLLHRIALVLATDGPFVTRHALIPRGFDPAAYRAEVLLQQFRRGEIDEAEFGFGMRLVGHYESCYDPDTFLLDNACLFRKCEEAHRRGALSESEHKAIRRYYFAGKNCLLPQARWEELLQERGYRFTTQSCRGKSWYFYYVVYSCSLNGQATEY